MINIKKFQCEVEITAKYIIEFDESIINKEWMDNFSRYFYSIDTLEEHAEYITEQISIHGVDTFIEGYGFPRIIYHNENSSSNSEPYEYKRFGVEESYINHGITIHVIEGEYVYVDTYRLKD